jgi:hypothetical protein
MVSISWDSISKGVNQRGGGWFIFAHQRKLRNESRRKSRTSLPEGGLGWMNIPG